MQGDSAQNPTNSIPQPQTDGTVTDPNTGKRFPGRKIIPTILGILLLLGGVGAGLVLVRQQQDIREKAATICCNAGNCNDGSEYGSDLIGIPQADCPARAREFCASRGSTPRSGGEQITCPSTATPPPSTSTPGGLQPLGNSCTVGGTTECQSGLCDNCTCNQSGGLTEGLCVSSRTTAGCSEACNIKYGTFAEPGGTGGGGTSTNGIWANNSIYPAVGTCNNGNCQILSSTCTYFGSPGNPYISSFYCDSPTIPCRDNPQGGTNPLPARSCGSGQIDIGCTSGGVIAYSSFNTGVVCGAATPSPTPPPGGATPSPTPPPSIPPGTTLSAQCLNVRVYDEDGNDITLPLTTGARTLNPGDIIIFGVKGTTTSGAIDMARFTVNGTLLPETTTIRAGTTDEFVSQYTVPTGVTTIGVAGEIHHPTLGWF